MRNLLITVLLSLIIYGCAESSNPVNPQQSAAPIWPMPGYNSRNTSNPYALNAVMNPVLNGSGDWSFSFPIGNYSDGSEFCVDSRGFIYYLHQIGPLGTLYKFSPDGNVVWSKDSLMQNNYAGISLNSDETKIYVVAYQPRLSDKLYCLDSSGNHLWSIDSARVSKPAVGKDGTVYIFGNGGLTAVSPDGIVKWSNTAVTGSYNQNIISLDRDDNIYTVSGSANVVKVGKTGNVIWQYGVSNDNKGIVIDGFGNIYFNVYTENKLYCLNQSGQLKWTKQNMNNYTTPVITSKNRIVVSSGAYIISYDTSGTELWRTQALSDLSSPETVLLDDADNVYYLGNPFGIKAASVSPAGVKRWETNSFNLVSILPPPALLPQGKLIIVPKRASMIQAIN